MKDNKSLQMKKIFSEVQIKSWLTLELTIHEPLRFSKIPASADSLFMH